MMVAGRDPGVCSELLPAISSATGGWETGGVEIRRGMAAVFPQGANWIRPGAGSPGGVSWLVSRPRKKLIKTSSANNNLALAA